MAEYSSVLLAFGGNEAGAWGEPAAAILRAFGDLEQNGVRLGAKSRLIATKAFGPAPQPDYVNAVASGITALDAEALLALIKQLEWAAGRRPGPRWGPRPLDIDILDFGGTILGWDRPHDPKHPAHLVLPHPELANRDFVLALLAEVAPDWRHPVSGLTPRQMLTALK